MKGVFCEGGRRPPVVKVLPDPKPKADQVVLDMKVAGICGSDIHASYRSEKGNKLIPGHEGAGIVEEIGSMVENVKLGDRVVAYQTTGCGYCELCRAGYDQYCLDRSKHSWLNTTINGSHADKLLIPAVACLELPEELSFADGAVTGCAGGTAYNALGIVESNASSSIGIYGLGPVGLSGLMLAKAMGAKVIGVDMIPERLKLAEQLGADHVVDFANENPVESIISLTGKKGVDICLECSGAPEAQINAVKSTKAPFGRVCFVGWMPGRNAMLDVGLTGGRWITRSFVFGMKDWKGMLDLMIYNDVHLDKMVTHRFPLEKAAEAYEVADKGHCGKVIFTF